MATSKRRTGAPLKRAPVRRSNRTTPLKQTDKSGVTQEDQGAGPLLHAQPWRFELFQAIRLLELLDLSCDSLARANDARNEAVRLRGHPSLAFVGGEIAGSRPKEAEKPSELSVTVPGLYGTLGTLPLNWTERLLQGAEGKEDALRDLLDALTHAALGLLYRAWVECQPGIAYERWKNAEKRGVAREHIARLRVNDVVTQELLAFADMTDFLAAPQGDLRPETLAYYSGLFTQQPRSASGLQALLEDHFAVPVEVIPCGMLHPPPAEIAEGFRLRLGPLAEVLYRAFLPGGSALRALLLLTRLYVGNERDWDIVLTTENGVSPDGCILSFSDRGSLLGWTSWLRDEPSRASSLDEVHLPASQCRQEERLAQ